VNAVSVLLWVIFGSLGLALLGWILIGVVNLLTALLQGIAALLTGIAGLFGGGRDRDGTPPP
jgi:hypothetical protein